VQAFLGALVDHDTSERLGEIAAPTLVLAGDRDMTSRPELCRAVAELIPSARFEVSRTRRTSHSRKYPANATTGWTLSGAKSTRSAKMRRGPQAISFNSAWLSKGI
jgi:hypothetical protein